MKEKIIWWIRCVGTWLEYGGNRQRKKDIASLYLKKLGFRIHTYGWKLSWQHTINHYGFQDWGCMTLAGEELERYLKKPWPIAKKEKEFIELAIITEYELPMKNPLFRFLTR